MLIILILSQCAPGTSDDKLAGNYLTQIDIFGIELPVNSNSLLLLLKGPSMLIASNRKGGTYACVVNDRGVLVFLGPLQLC